MLLIDGHNLIGRSPGLSLEREEEGREQVLRRLAAQAGRRRVVVVFDGDRPAAQQQRFGGVEVVFAPRGRTADDELIARLSDVGPRGATVVTSDRELAQRATWLGARVLSCEEFLARRPGKPRGRIRPTEPEPAVPAEEVETWLRAFRGKHKM